MATQRVGLLPFFLPEEKYTKKSSKRTGYGVNRMHVTSNAMLLFLPKRKMTTVSHIILFRGSTSLSIGMSLLQWICQCPQVNCLPKGGVSKEFLSLSHSV